MNKRLLVASLGLALGIAAIAASPLKSSAALQAPPSPAPVPVPTGSGGSPVPDPSASPMAFVSIGDVDVRRK